MQPLTSLTILAVALVSQFQQGTAQGICNVFPMNSLKCTACNNAGDISSCLPNGFDDVCSGPFKSCLTVSLTDTQAAIPVPYSVTRSCVEDAREKCPDGLNESICTIKDNIKTCYECNYLPQGPQNYDGCTFPPPPGLVDPAPTTTEASRLQPETCEDGAVLTTVNFANTDYLDVSIRGPSASEDAESALQGSGGVLDITRQDTYIIEFPSPVTVWHLNFTSTGASKFTMKCFDESGEMFFSIDGMTSFPAGLSLIFLRAPNGERGTTKLELSFPIASDQVSLSNLRALICSKVCDSDDINRYDYSNDAGFVSAVIGEGSDQDARLALAGSGGGIDLPSSSSLVFTMIAPTDVIDFSVGTGGAQTVTVVMKNQAQMVVFSGTESASGGGVFLNAFAQSLGVISGVTSITVTATGASVVLVSGVFFRVCQEEDEPCVCRVRGDPILMPCFKQGLRFLNGQNSYMLASSPVVGCKWDVSIITATVAQNVVIPVNMLVSSYGYELEIFRNHTMTVGGNEVSLPWESENPDFPIRCETENDRYLVCVVQDCGAQFGFWGKKGMSEGIVYIPASVLPQTSGQCIGPAS